MRALKVAAAVAVCTVTAAAAATSQASLTIVVFDYASTPHRLLASAINEGRRAFHAAGISTDWIVCDPGQSCSVPEQFVQVKILAHPLKAVPVSDHGLAATTTCSVTDHCASSYLFADRVEGFASRTGASIDVAMGYVMAHEIGHLMGLGHRPGGIMTAAFTTHDLDRAAEGWLYFADDDARTLRNALSRTQIAGDPVRRVTLSPARGDIAE